MAVRTAFRKLTGNVAGESITDYTILMNIKASVFFKIIVRAFNRIKSNGSLMYTATLGSSIYGKDVGFISSLTQF